MPAACRQKFESLSGPAYPAAAPMPKLPALARCLYLSLSLLLATAVPTQAAPETLPGDGVLQLPHDMGRLPLAAQAQPGSLLLQARDTASGLVLSAMNFLGVPYRRGGGSAARGFDCSGFTRYVFESSLGRVLPRRADQQARDTGLMPVTRDELEPGDLVFFNTMRSAFSHVGIYVGDGKFIHAPRSGGAVRIEDMRQTYWARRFNGARRASAMAEDTEATEATEATTVRP